MQGEFANGSLFWFWYDALLAAPALVLAAIITLRVLFRTSWTSTMMLVARLVTLLGTSMVLLIVLDRLGIQTVAIAADAYGLLSIVGAAIAVIAGVLALVFSRIGKPREGEKGKPEPREAKDLPTGEAPGTGAPAGATMVLSRVPKSPAWLVVRSGGVAGEIFEFNQDRITIGRGGESDYQLDDPSIGAPHALIRVKEGRYLLYDLGSASGTWVNDSSIAGTFLSDGSRISMGASELFFTKIDAGPQEGESGGEGKRGVLLVRSGASSGQTFYDGVKPPVRQLGTSFDVRYWPNDVVRYKAFDLAT